MLIFMLNFIRFFHTIPHILHLELYRTLIDPLGDRRTGGYLYQRISIATHRGNAASKFGTLSRGPSFIGRI